MSDGGAQHKEFGPYFDDNGDIYRGIKVLVTGAGGTTAKTYWTDEDKTTAVSSGTLSDADNDGIARAFFDGDYRFRVTQSDDSALDTAIDWDNVKVTSDTATMWEGNFGTSYPSAAASNKWQQFLKVDGSDNILELGFNNGSSFQNILTPSFDVRTYGAVCDGSTDDATAVQAAMDAAAASGGTVLVSGFCGVGAASWVGLTLTSKNNVTIMGQGQNAGFKLLAVPSQTLTNHGSRSKGMFKLDTCTFIEFRNLNFDGDTVEGCPITMESTTSSKVLNCFFKDVTNTNNAAIITEGCDYNTYKNNEFSNCYGAQQLGSANSGAEETYATITGNLYRDNATGPGTHGFGGSMQNCVMSDNVVKGGKGVGISLGSTGTTTTSKNNVIKGNVVEGCALTGIELLTSTDGEITNTTVVGNVVENNGSDGILALAMINGVIADNVVIDNNQSAGNAGIMVSTITTTGTPIKRLTVANNVCYSTAGSDQERGIYINGKTFDCEDINIIGNYCGNHDLQGILVAGGTACLRLNVSDNVVVGNDTDGVRLNGTWTNGIVANNMCIGNDTDAGGNIDLFIDSADAGGTFQVTGNNADTYFFGTPSNMSGNRLKTLTTTDATETSLWNMTLSEASVAVITAQVIGNEDSTSRNTYFKRVFVYRDTAGAATIQGAVVDVAAEIESQANWICTFTVSGNDVRLRVTGEAATTVKWDATVEVVCNDL